MASTAPAPRLTTRPLQHKTGETTACMTCSHMRVHLSSLLEAAQLQCCEACTKSGWRTSNSGSADGASPLCRASHQRRANTTPSDDEPEAAQSQQVQAEGGAEGTHALAAPVAPAAGEPAKAGRSLQVQRRQPRLESGSSGSMGSNGGPQEQQGTAGSTPGAAPAGRTGVQDVRTARAVVARGRTAAGAGAGGPARPAHPANPARPASCSADTELTLRDLGRPIIPVNTINPADCTAAAGAGGNPAGESAKPADSRMADSELTLRNLGAAVSDIVAVADTAGTGQSPAGAAQAAGELALAPIAPQLQLRRRSAPAGPRGLPQRRSSRAACGSGRRWLPTLQAHNPRSTLRAVRPVRLRLLRRYPGTPHMRTRLRVAQNPGARRSRRGSRAHRWLPTPRAHNPRSTLQEKREVRLRRGRRRTRWPRHPSPSWPGLQAAQGAPRSK